MVGVSPLQIVVNWPFWWLAFLVYLSFVVVGGGIAFLFYTMVKEINEGTLW